MAPTISNARIVFISGLVKSVYELEGPKKEDKYIQLQFSHY
jgi:hypothetical protein